MDKAKEWAGTNFGDHPSGTATQGPAEKRSKTANLVHKVPDARGGKTASDDKETMSKARRSGGRKNNNGPSGLVGSSGATGPKGKNNRERCMTNCVFGPLTIVCSSLSASGYQGVYAQKTSAGMPPAWRAASVVHSKWTQIGLFSTALIAAQACALYHRDSSLPLPCSEEDVLSYVIQLTGSRIDSIPDPSNLVSPKVTTPVIADGPTGPTATATEHAASKPAAASSRTAAAAKDVRPKYKTQKVKSATSGEAHALPRLQRVASTREGEEMDFVDGGEPPCTCSNYCDQRVCYLPFYFAPDSDSPPVSLRGESDDEMIMN
jgi:hypothetical protein